jgi:hypothetical protein
MARGPAPTSFRPAWGALLLVATLLGSACGPDPGLVLRRKPVDDGTFVHRGSRLRFPEHAAGFERDAPDKYDDAGEDWGIGYSRPVGKGRVEATIFVFPPPERSDGTPMTPAEQFATELEELRKDKIGLKEIARREVQGSLTGSSVLLRVAEFTVRGERPFGVLPEPAPTLLASFAYGAWRVTYRVSAMGVSRDAAWAAFEELLAALGLPSVVAAAPTPPAGAPPR